jgi:hypothetical protein
MGTRARLVLPLLVVIVVVGLASVTTPLPADAYLRPTARPFAVSCSSSIGTTRNPGQGGSRVLFGTVSIPPAVNPRVVAVQHHGRWREWRKAGLAVRAGSASVSVIVPIAWRSRAAITWGDSPIVSAMQFSGCSAGRSPGQWNAYAGGFYLHASSACVPLVIASGRRQTTVRFGVGRTCP